MTREREALDAAMDRLHSTHWDGSGCGIHDAGACSRCYGPSPADAREEAELRPKSSAVLSDDGLFRYGLVREFAPMDARFDRGRVCFQLCNPSKADATVNDPTVRKGIGFAYRWGYSCIEYVNRGAFRATKPTDLLKVSDPIGPENRSHILAAFARADLVVFAWGNAWPSKLDHLSPIVAHPGSLCLGRTGSGAPRHPLMLAYSTPLEPWVSAEAER